MNIVAIGVIVLAVLVWAGRRGSVVRPPFALLRALVAVLAAVGATVCGLRGLWPGTVLLVMLAAAAGGAATVGASWSPPRAPPRESDDREALAILGLGAGAGRPEIEAAYRRLMRRAHPDRGGTTGLAAQLNAARDRLLRSLR